MRMRVVAAHDLLSNSPRGPDCGKVIGGVDVVAGRVRENVRRAAARLDLITAPDEQAATFVRPRVTGVRDNLIEHSLANTNRHDISTTMAMPIPPPMHKLATPRPPPRRRSA